MSIVRICPCVLLPTRQDNKFAPHFPSISLSYWIDKSNQTSHDSRSLAPNMHYGSRWWVRIICPCRLKDNIDVKSINRISFKVSTKHTTRPSELHGKRSSDCDRCILSIVVKQIGWNTGRDLTLCYGYFLDGCDGRKGDRSEINYFQSLVIPRGISTTNILTETRGGPERTY